MDKFLAALGGLVVLALAFLLAPIGIAAALAWRPEQTNAAMTGVFSVCGGGIVALGLGAGVVGGITLMRHMGQGKPDGGDQVQYIAPPPQPFILDQPQAASAMEYLRQQKLMGDIERQRLALESDRRKLEAPRTAAQPDAWASLQAPGWVDAVGGGDWGGSSWSDER